MGAKAEGLTQKCYILRGFQNHLGTNNDARSSSFLETSKHALCLYTFLTSTLSLELPNQFILSSLQVNSQLFQILVSHLTLLSYIFLSFYLLACQHVCCRVYIQQGMLKAAHSGPASLFELRLFLFSMTPISFVFASTTSAVASINCWQNSKSFRLLKFKNPSSGSKVTDL